MSSHLQDLAQFFSIWLLLPPCLPPFWPPQGSSYPRTFASLFPLTARFFPRLFINLTPLRLFSNISFSLKYALAPHPVLLAP